MNWFHQLFFGSPTNVAHIIAIYAFVIAIGSWLGKFKVYGISLGVTFVLFVGLFMGHLGVEIDHEVLDFIKDFGLVLFVYTIGLQVGPSFFATFKQGGLKLNLITLGYVSLTVVTTLAIYYILGGRVELPMMVGIMQGAVTNTPGLGAAVEALNQLGYEDMPIGLGYAVAYPLGIVGVLLCYILIKAIFRIDIDKENEELKRLSNEEAEELSKMTIRITNHHLDGKTVAQCVKLIGRKYVISRMMDNGNLIVPAADTVIHYDDVILVVTTKEDEEAVLAFLGEIDDSVVWKEDDSSMVSRRIVVTRDEVNGKRIRNLKLRSVYGVNITRVSRSGVDLVATPDLTLQVGDKVMVVGPIEAVKKAEKMLGDTLKRLRYPHLISLFLGILAGIIVGSIPIYFPNMPMPAKLGLAGGPLIVSILVGRFGYKIKLISYTTQSANLMLREMGISLFLASVGISAGGKFLATIVEGDGLLWVGLGFIITFVPAIIIGVVARKFLKMNYGTLMGLMAGSTTNPSALAYSTQTAGNDAPAVAYSTVYPLTMFLRIIIAQMLILIMV